MHLSELSDEELRKAGRSMLSTFLSKAPGVCLAMLIQGNYSGDVEQLFDDRSVAVSAAAISLVKRLTDMYESKSMNSLPVTSALCKCACSFVQFVHLMNVVILRSFFYSDVKGPFDPNSPRTAAEMAAIARITTVLKLLTKPYMIESGGPTMFAVFPQMLTGMTDTLNYVSGRWELERLDPSAIEIITEGFHWLLIMSYNFSIKKFMVPHPRIASGRLFEVTARIIPTLATIALYGDAGRWAAGMALDRIFVTVANLIGDDRLDPNAPAFLDSISWAGVAASNAMAALLSAVVDFIAAALHERKWCLDALFSALKVLELFADDSNFKGIAIRLATPKIFAPVFLFPSAEICAMAESYAGSRRVLEMLFRCAGNLHCFNPDVSNPEDKNEFARALAAVFMFAPTGNCMGTFMSIFQSAMSANGMSVENEAPIKIEHDFKSISEALLKTNLIAMDYELFSELTQATSNLLSGRSQQQTNVGWEGGDTELNNL